MSKGPIASSSRGRRSVRGLVFDCDGVLVDSEPLAWRAWRELLAEAGYTPTDDDVEVCTGMTDELTYAYFLDTAELAPRAELLARFESRARNMYPGGLKVFPDAWETVRGLAAVGVPMAVASNGHRPRLDLALEVSGLGRYFDCSVCSDDVVAAKPAPDVYLAAAACLGLAPDACIAVEDTVTGATSAQAAGMRVVTVARGGVGAPGFPVTSMLDSELFLLWLGLS